MLNKQENFEKINNTYKTLMKGKMTKIKYNKK